LEVVYSKDPPVVVVVQSLFFGIPPIYPLFTIKSTPTRSLWASRPIRSTPAP
jgi:hypothetical protein